jgi:hypothetical protein
MIYKIIIIIIVILIGLLYDRYNNNNIEKFINNFKITQSIKCFNNNKNLIKFSEEINNIFDKYDIENGELELSTKFSENDINANRLVAFIPCEHLKKHENLINECYDINEIPKNIGDNLYKLINDNKKNKCQILFGIDLNEKSKRVYFNYISENKINLVGFNIEKDLITKKVYNEIEKTTFKKSLYNFINNEIYNTLIKIFPENIWKIVGVKENTSYYINLLYEYKLNYFENNIFNLLKCFYKNNDDNLNKWYNCFKNNNITWIAIGKDKNKNLFLTIYFVYNKNIRNSFDIQKLIDFNNELKLIKSIL